MIETSLLALDIRYQPIAQNWKEIVSAYLLPQRFPGYSVRVTETRRTLARQEAVLADKASTLLIGWHNFGLAFDFGVFGPDGTYEKTDKTGIYRACGYVGMALGLRWGGNWDRDNIIQEPGENDLGHLEHHPNGVTLAELKAAAGLTA